MYVTFYCLRIPFHFFGLHNTVPCDRVNIRDTLFEAIQLLTKCSDSEN
jgi:hypothetical protein